MVVDIYASFNSALIAETRYVTVEQEIVTVVWDMAKWKFYLFRLQNFIVMTDHRPLIPILNSTAVVNPRLQEKASPYLFIAVWRAGKLLHVPDALFCTPVRHTTPVMCRYGYIS